MEHEGHSVIIGREMRERFRNENSLEGSQNKNQVNDDKDRDSDLDKELLIEKNKTKPNFMDVRTPRIQENRQEKNYLESNLRRIR